MAIAYDTFSKNDGGIATTNTYSHTCASGAFLTTQAIFIQSPTPTGSATYNGTSMTSGVENTSVAFQRDVAYYLANPTSGAHNVVTTGSASCRNFGGSISLTGCNGTIGATATANGTSTTPSISLTTTSANSWVIAFIYINDTITNTNPTATGTNQTQRYTLDHVVGGVSMAASTQTTTTTGSYTSSWSLSVSNIWSATAIEVVPSVSSATTNPAFLLKMI